MQIDRNNIDELTARLTLTVEPADYTERVQKILNDYEEVCPVSWISKRQGAHGPDSEAVCGTCFGR